MNLANKVIWITGASSGIGEAITYALAKENCKLVISARRIEELKRVKANTKLSDDKILVLPIDLEQHQYAKDWTKKVTDKFNKIEPFSYIGSPNFTSYSSILGSYSIM